MDVEEIQMRWQELMLQTLANEFGENSKLFNLKLELWKDIM